MTRWLGVITEHEHRQFKCSHYLEKLDPKDPHSYGFKYQCLKCGKSMMRLNGVVRPGGGVKDMASELRSSVGLDFESQGFPVLGSTNRPFSTGLKCTQSIASEQLTNDISRSSLGSNPEIAIFKMPGESAELADWRGVSRKGRTMSEYPKVPKNLSFYMSKMGRKGGKVGGSARAAKLSAERRLEIARNAAAKRWAAKCPTCGGPMCEHDICSANWCGMDERCQKCADREWREIEAEDEARYYQGNFE